MCSSCLLAFVMFPTLTSTWIIPSFSKSSSLIKLNSFVFRDCIEIGDAIYEDDFWDKLFEFSEKEHAADRVRALRNQILERRDEEIEKKNGKVVLPQETFVIVPASSLTDPDLHDYLQADKLDQNEEFTVETEPKVDVFGHSLKRLLGFYNATYEPPQEWELEGLSEKQVEFNNEWREEGKTLRYYYTRLNVESLVRRTTCPIEHQKNFYLDHYNKEKYCDRATKRAMESLRDVDREELALDYLKYLRGNNETLDAVALEYLESINVNVDALEVGVDGGDFDRLSRRSVEKDFFGRWSDDGDYFDRVFTKWRER